MEALCSNCVNYCYFIIFTVSLVYFTDAEILADYMHQRKLFLENEKSIMTGGNIILNNKEVKVNQILMKFKEKEINTSVINNDFPPSKHFFYSKKDIDNSNVFKILKKLPKGAALHQHDSSMVDVRWLVKIATYMDNCYMSFSDGQLKFKFLRNADGVENSYWQLTAAERKKYGAQQFDTWLYNNMTLVDDHPYTRYPSQSAVWKTFYSLFEASDGLVFYEPVFKAYFIEAMQEFYDDNVQYIEFRGLLPQVYDLVGTEYSKEWMVETYQNLTKQFVNKYPDFSGTKFIYSSSRGSQALKIKSAIHDAIQLNQKYPDYFIGYDLVGQEDPGHSLKYFIGELLSPSQSGPTLQYFFHAGETDWEGKDVDENLIDALLLNATRIGHGFALLKHPYAIKMGREKKVAIEVCPISNQVLKLVDDLRNHPAAALLTTSYPVVISSDDPGLWGATGLSYDFYQAFMGLGGAKADLAFLKQLAIDSLRYSGMTDTEKKAAFILWLKKWDMFLDEILKTFY